MDRNTQPAESAELPVVLGHAACTGGSLIYRVLTTTFGFCSLSEVGVARAPGRTRYNPWDPQYQLFARQEISPLEFSDILFQRICDCENRARKNGTRLLVREHTHSFFFNPLQRELEPKGGSWFADLYRHHRSQVLPCIVSVRDPIDSWLGFRRSFEQQEPDHFDTYCGLYNRYLDKVDNQQAQDQSVVILKYETFLENPQSQMDAVAALLRMTPPPVDLSSVGKLFGSGNSGRVADKLTKPSRRAYTNRFLSDAASSTEYQRLCARLEYPLIHESVQFLDRVRARSYSVMAGLIAGPLRLIESKGRDLRESIKTGKNIQ